ncbi:MAG: hypothetical protein M1836_003772 [Candelina mexicana]|nr:MAG: hypothetical protein M1836_003772 [Candelina mexicana]
MLSRLHNWIYPPPPSTTLRALRIPADGSPPHLLTLTTIAVASAGNVDCFLGRIPDLREFWGSGDGWHWRDIVHLEIQNQAVNPGLEGFYFGFKSFNDEALPIHKLAPGVCGDAFFVKIRDEQGDRDEQGVGDGWATYDDVEEEILGSGLVRVILRRLSQDEGGVLGGEEDREEDRRRLLREGIEARLRDCDGDGDGKRYDGVL